MYSDPIEIVLYCKICGDPCVRTVLGDRRYVHYDELVDLAGQTNYDHECEVPLHDPAVIEVDDHK